ncbi:hypothetical protein EMIT0P100_20005 [Pseudomonas sp. IT-P100]
MQHTGVNSHAAAGDGIKVDLEGHLLIADSQAEQAADGALVVAFADAQHRPPRQRSEEPAAFLAGQFADVHRVALTDNGRAIRQQPTHGDRTAGGLGRALDQIVGVFGGAHYAQTQLCWLNRPTGITEDAEYNLRNGLGALIGHAGGRLRLREHEATEQTENACQHDSLAGNNVLCRPDSHFHAGIPFGRNGMMPQR